MEYWSRNADLDSDCQKEIKKNLKLRHCTLVQILGFCPTILFQPFLGRFLCPIRQVRGFWGRENHFW